MDAGRRAPGIGMTCGPKASSHASTTCCGLTPCCSPASRKAEKRSPTSRPPPPVPPSGLHGRNAMPCSPQYRSSSMLPGCRGELVLHAREVALAEHLLRDLDLFDARVRDADGADESLLLERRERGHDLAVDQPAVGPVVLVEVDHLDAEDLERALHGQTEVHRRAVATPRFTLAARDAALGGDEDARAVAAPGAQGLGDDALVVTHLVPRGRVDVCGVDEGDAGVECGVHGGDRVLMRRELIVVVHRHGHGAQPDRRHLPAGQCALLHRVSSSSRSSTLPGAPGSRPGLDKTPSSRSRRRYFGA